MVVHWLLVVIFDHTKYENVPESMINMICHSDLICYPRENKHWICEKVVSVYFCQQESCPKIEWEFEFPEDISKKKIKTLFHASFSPIW